jgi:uncharacterized protein (DUF58 family)
MASAEFAEHKVYNVGESTKHIDWKLYAKTDRLYAKRFEEETTCAAILLSIIRHRCIIPIEREPAVF